MEFIIEETLSKELELAAMENEIPVSALIVFNNEIICSAHNERIARNDVTAHAEVLAIKKAAEKLGDWRLNGCDLYVTLKPCKMCEEIIKESRINRVFYYLDRDQTKKGFYKTTFELLTEKNSNSFQQLFSNFFKDNCNR